MAKQKPTRREPEPVRPVTDEDGFTFGAKPLEPDPEAPPVIEPVASAPTEPVPEWCKFCQAPRLIDTKNAHWCGQCRREPLPR